MGARSLESRLRDRLLAVAAPAFVVVAALSVLVTARALEAADAGVASMRARSVLRTVRGEIAEGDAVDVALAESVTQSDAEDVRVVIRERSQPRAAGRPMPPALASLEDGCANAYDDRGRAWRACAARDAELTAVVAIDTEPHRAVVRTLAETMVGIVLAVLAAIVIAARFAVRGPLASLSALVAWSERVVSADASPPPAPPADTLEIARLTTAFDALVTRLVGALARERASSAHIAHELRTPLTALRGELDALPSSAGDAVARMREDVTRLARVIDAILVLSSPPRDDVAATVVNVADVVRELTTNETRVLAPDEALAFGDPRLVELAIRNLLENARKYSGHAAREVRVTRAGEAVRVAVVDDGPGLDEAARARMFDRYWRGASDHGGTGLGLALVRAVAERHGGTAEALPNAAGRGLEVAISFGHVAGWHEGDAR